MKIEKVEMQLPRDVYKNTNAVQLIKDEANDIFFLHKLEWKEGVVQHIKDAEYPIKGFTSPETMFFVNIAKKDVIELAKILALPIFWPSYLVLLILPHKYKMKVLNKMLASVTRKIHGVIGTFILKPKHQMPITQEIDWLLFSCLEKLGVETTLAEKFAESFSHLIEYDNAYRYRVQDILSESSREKMTKNPSREIRRLMKILSERDPVKDVSYKLKLMGLGVSVLLMFGKFKKAFVEALKECEFSKFQYDDADEYWVAFRKDYLFQGKTQEERAKIQEDLGLYMPKTQKL